MTVKKMVQGVEVVHKAAEMIPEGDAIVVDLNPEVRTQNIVQAIMTISKAYDIPANQLMTSITEMIVQKHQFGGGHPHGRHVEANPLHSYLASDETVQQPVQKSSQSTGRYGVINDWVERWFGEK